MADMPPRRPQKVGARREAMRARIQERKFASAFLEQHANLLRNSAVSKEIAAARGYRTVIKPQELAQLGFAANQQSVPTLLIPVWGVDGKVVSYQHRPDDPRSKKGKSIKYETLAGSRMVLDVPPTIRDKLGDPSVPLWITEGARKADAGVSASLCCIALLGVWNWRGTNSSGGKVALPDWESVALNGRKVYIVFDSDVTEKAQVRKALERLKSFLERRGAKPKIIRLQASEDGTKVGLDDFFAAGGTVEELIQQKEGPPTDGPSGGEGKATQAQLILEFAAEIELDICRDPQGYAYVTFSEGEHFETWPLKSGHFKKWLAYRFYLKHRKPAPAQALNDAIGVLGGWAQFQGTEREVPIRIGMGEREDLYVDLANPEWEAVRVTTTGWKVQGEPRLRFRRAKGMLPLPRPTRRLPYTEKNGVLNELREFINAPEETGWRLILGWLVGTFNPTGPYPMLVLQGEQGSAKSTAARVLRELVDPSDVPLRSMPRDERDMMISARNSWVLGFDNLSGFPAWLADAFCRMATGGGISTRELYTDADEFIFKAARPVILNGIDDLVWRNDLADRALVVTLPRIPEGSYLAESPFWEAFKEAQPRILGGLLDAVSAALSNIHKVSTSDLPRMADFAKWVMAAEPALPWRPGEFLAAYNENRNDVVGVALESDKIAELVREMLEEPEEEWTGTATQLLHCLDDCVDDQTRRAKSWPKTPRTLSSRLRRAAPFLLNVGINVEFHREPHTRRRIVSLKRNPQNSGPTGPMPQIPATEIQDYRGGDAGAARYAKPRLLSDREEDDKYWAQIVDLNGWDAETALQMRKRSHRKS